MYCCNLSKYTILILCIIYSNKSQTLSTQSKCNCTAVDISPNGCLMVVTCEDGQAYMISMVSQTIIHKYKFQKEPACVKFSPDGKLFGVCVEHLSENRIMI